MTTRVSTMVASILCGWVMTGAGCCGGNGVAADLSPIEGGYAVSGVWGLDATLLETTPGSWTFSGSLTYPTTGFETEGPLGTPGDPTRLVIDVTPPAEGEVVIPVLTRVDLGLAPIDVQGIADWDVRVITACPVC